MKNNANRPPTANPSISMNFGLEFRSRLQKSKHLSHFLKIVAFIYTCFSFSYHIFNNISLNTKYIRTSLITTLEHVFMRFQPIKKHVS